LIAPLLGHAGHETADLAAEMLPKLLKTALSAALQTDREGHVSLSAISDILSKGITDFDDSIAKDITDIFPGGLEEIGGLSDDNIRKIIGEGNAKILRGMSGSTALIALADPARSNLWVASLGDCQAGASKSFRDRHVNELTLFGSVGKQGFQWSLEAVRAQLISQR